MTALAAPGRWAGRPARWPRTGSFPACRSPCSRRSSACSTACRRHARRAGAVAAASARRSCRLLGGDRRGADARRCAAAAMLLALLVLPLFVPVLIFGAGAAEARGRGPVRRARTCRCSGRRSSLRWSGCPWRSGAAVRIAVD
ncbi:MAG: hypothetical protein MZW92_36140 [Comamonadaceae bacterium]|nr:hypothetical protein [Comamonadaceae bacterium]